MVCSGIDKGLVDCGAFACGLAMDLLVCGIGAAFCGGCAVRDEVLSLHEGCLASFGRVAVLLEGRGTVALTLTWNNVGM